MKKEDQEKKRSLLKMLNEDIPLLRAKALDIEKDTKGIEASGYALSLRSIGVLEYLLNKNIKIFKMNLAETSRIRLNLFRRYDQGEPISKSYVSMIAYQYIFNALAAANFTIAEELAAILGGRDAIEREFDHPFDYNFGYTLKWSVLKNPNEIRIPVKRFSEICQEKLHLDFKGYVMMFNAILNKDSHLAKESVNAIIEGHEKLSKGRAVFAYSDDKFLCVWGIGIVNLARNSGLDVPSVPPLIPEDLLVQNSKNRVISRMWH